MKKVGLVLSHLQKRVITNILETTVYAKIYVVKEGLIVSSYLSLSVGLLFLMLTRLLWDARLDLLDGGSGARPRFPLDQVRLLATDCLQQTLRTGSMDSIYVSR